MSPSGQLREFGPSQISPFPHPYLCATTMVVRWVQTLAREAWMFLSVSVSSADVACGRGRVWGRDTGRQLLGQGLLQSRARLGWGRCCYLIQQDDVGTLQDGACDGDALLLPPAQLQPPFPHLGVVSCRHKGRNVLCWCLRD